MNALTVLLACLAGGCGAVLRFTIDAAVTRRVGGRLPWGTLTVNVSGALALGVVTGIMPTLLALPAATVIAAGLLGGYTTFSTACVQTAELLASGRRAAAVVSAMGMLAASALAGGAGLVLGRALGSA
ncbi:CrcB family protein [Microbacterium proteolyticum]|uniref:fluoride efflux transporter FluC n=1 Tax=Microbacterium proteolyticum TaxID=1572644 RepID=UPI002416A04E|nr:CrcB family protein [Microbacterium proteolyticum]